MQKPFLDSFTKSDLRGALMEELTAELKEKIIATLDLIDVTPRDFNEDEPLVGGKLGIDSIDVLELAMMIDKDYGIKIDNKELGQKVFATLKTLVEYIHTHRRG
jgi:acyl carrier protein